jgi:hypothetical protein
LHAEGGGRSHRPCELPQPGTTDIAFIASPCQPFSVMRDQRKTVAEGHKSFCVSFGEKGSAITYATSVKPHILIVEQVLGMLKRGKGEQGDTFKDRLMKAMLEIPKEAGDGYHFDAGICLSDVSPEMFISARRPRSSAWNVTGYFPHHFKYTRKHVSKAT